MQPCPQCKSLLEPWEVFCHGCGRVISLEQVPVVKEAAPDKSSLKEAFEDWYGRGKEAAGRQDFETASVCFQEALRRQAGLSDSALELSVRMQLAEALERTKKLAEAALQYQAVAERAPDADERRIMAAKADNLKEAAVVETYVPTADDYSHPQPFELKVLPLYCAACKRRLTEGEIYGFRRGLMKAPRCVCGFEGAPLVKRTSEAVSLVKHEHARQKRKTVLIEAASGIIPGGKKKEVAALLAVLLGAVGAQKFYLGERMAGILSIVFSWTFIPAILGLLEAIRLLGMSQVSFNLQYNVELVVERLPARAVDSEPDQDTFSMEITEDPEDFVDDLTGPETAGSKKV